MNKIKPDDYYNNGVLEMVRFGEKIIMKNNMSFVQYKQLTAHLKAKYNDLMCEIDEKVALIRYKVVMCDPVQLLSFSSDMGLMTFLNLFSEFNVSSQDIPIVRATEYIQSILVSSLECETLKVDGDNSALFHEILKDIEDLHTLIQHFYICWGSKMEELIPDIDEDMIKYLMEAQTLYLVRGQRYQIFEVEYYQKLLKAHDNIFTELFNLNSSDIVEGIKKLQYSLSQGKADTMNQFHKLFEEFKNYQGDNEEKFFLEHQFEGEDYYNKLFGTQLRDVVKITGWPDKFVDELSWELNSVTNFFNQQQFSGWPIIDLPVFKRPFIKIDNIAYCFDYYSFVDNFYRVLQKTVTRLCPSYIWADFQQQASEKMVEDIFKSLLPNCITFLSNYYPLNSSMKQAAENDLIVLYDDTIIIVEVKAGSFVYTPPINDFKAHIKSYKTLIEKADWQCQRTKDYLTKHDNAPLFDANNQLKTNIDMTSISSIYMMSVTVDNINTFAAKAEKMGLLQLKSNAISIAVDDLMVYREYFQSPLMFLHFIQQRSIATQEPKLALNDELDHLGMYIKHNCYAFQANIIPKNAVGNFIGYREKLDDYFCKLYHPQLHTEKPIQNIPDLILRIIHYLESNFIEGRSYIANYFLNFATDAKEEFCAQVQYVLGRQRQIKREVPIHAAGTGDSLRYTCFINQQGIVEPTCLRKREYTLACLLWNTDPERYLIDLYFDSNNTFIKIHFERFTIQDIRTEEFQQIKKLGEEIASKRIYQYQQSHKGKIGRNQLCPCGSGKKYKKCCGR